MSEIDQFDTRNLYSTRRGCRRPISGIIMMLLLLQFFFLFYFLWTHDCEVCQPVQFLPAFDSSYVVGRVIRKTNLHVSPRGSMRLNTLRPAQVPSGHPRLWRRHRR